MDNQRKLQVLESTFFNVEKQEDEEGRLALFAGDRKLVNVSENYRLVTNREIVGPIVDRFGIDNLKRVKRSGRSFIYEIETGRQFGIAEKDEIKERIVIQNSYDKTRAFSFMFGAFRLVCSNGMYTGVSIGSFRKIHIGEIPVREIVENVVANYEQNSFENWNRMARVPLTQNREEQLIREFSAYEAEDDHSPNAYANSAIRSRALWAVGRPESVDNQRNAWGLYNALNAAIARTVPNNSFGKIILGNKNAESYLTQVILN